MRSIRFPVIVVAGLIAVVIGVAAAFVVGRDTAEPAQSAAAATPTTSAAGQPAGAAKPATAPKPTVTPKPGNQAASAAAVAFMRELGMRDPVAASFRSTTDATAEVGIHPRAGEGGRSLDEVTTLVQLRRYSGGWVVTAARATGTIEVDQPLAFTRVRSPLTVSGRSSAFEGTVNVTVTEDRRGPDHVLGKGFVNGGSDELAPFRGPISFRRPSADAGWVVFSGDTGADTGIMSATAVRIRFGTTAAAPRILGVRTTPVPVSSANVVTLTGSGTLTIGVGATNASEVRFLLVPSGTGNRPNAKLLGVVTKSDGGSGWWLSWRYQDEPFTGHLLIQVNGPGGTTEHDRIAIQHR